MASGSIIHPGIVDSIEIDKISVRILSQSACSACHAKQACTVADMKDKIIDIFVDKPKKWKVGEEVMVKMDESLGRKAVLLGYGLPFIILVVSIVIFLTILKSEGLAAVLSILMLVPYYFALYFFRKKLGKEFKFRIE